jgi:hypothetical protein
LLRNCPTEHAIEGMIEETGRRRGSRKKLLDGFKEKGGYWKLREEQVDFTLWKIRLEISYGPVVRQATE